MTEDNIRAPRLRVSEQMLHQVREWMAKNRKLILEQERTKRRLILKIIKETGLRRVYAENLFDTISQDRSLRAGSTYTPLNVSLPDPVYQNRAKCIPRLRAATERWEVAIAQHPPQQIYPLGPGATSAPDFPTNRVDERDCQSCVFDVEGPVIRGIRKRDDNE